jgi:uncharacterized protein
MNNLYNILNRNKSLFNVLEIISQYESEKLYIGAGAIAQTVWNHKFGNKPSYGINDIDIVYYNNKDLNESSEHIILESINKKFPDLSSKLDINNQARIHLWYKTIFGYEISPILSMENATERWPTTATSICTRLNKSNNLEIISPFGLNDLFSGIIRANKKQITKEIYTNKVDKWLKLWPQLIVIPW